jgi:hypothetical protein
MSHAHDATTRDPYADGVVSTGLRRWIPPALLAGMGLSLIIHVVLLAVALVVMVDTGAGNGKLGSPGEGQPIEMAIVTTSELASINQAELNSMVPAVEQSNTNNADLPITPMIDMPGGSALPDANGLGASGTGLGGAGDGKGIGVGPGQGGSGGGATKFFGVEAQGMRFAFVVDVSGSMSEQGKIDYLKKQLINAIDGMVDGAQFVVIAFSSDKQPLMGRERWTEVTQGNKRQAFKAINELQANGGTEPMSAFRVVLSDALKPRPDAVYFMTDGLFDPRVVDEVFGMLSVRGDRKVNMPIHCITFMDRSSEAHMKKLAERTGGTYRHVEAPPKP